MPWVPVTPSLPLRARSEQTDRGDSEVQSVEKSPSAAHTQGHVGMRALVSPSCKLRNRRLNAGRVRSYPRRDLPVPAGGVSKARSSEVLPLITGGSDFLLAVRQGCALHSEPGQPILSKSSLLGKQDDVELQLLKVGQALRGRENPRQIPMPSAEPEAGLDLTTLRSSRDPKSGVRCLID